QEPLDGADEVGHVERRGIGAGAVRPDRRVRSAEAREREGQGYRENEISVNGAYRNPSIK
ncbi:hypothetical protein, partial [Escherichia coli]|uniref:hypothetical protein n=1 Tax=Escherichia coli TaxID=562 RepID=UPI00197CFCEB